MKTLLIALAAAAVALAASALIPRAMPPVQAQMNADGCTCSRPTLLGSGAERLSVYHCVCPGMMCVVTATAAASMPPSIQQNCTDVRR
ncbi:MAG: hypothetical protein RMK97_06310 [Sutterellaceae bacterium]|nr:hypothetical protein [Burkholderiaceae bacterium]MCX7902106.1 hypothetical protein [Burkholderiaceae bacterium]MDW8430100.1 hypothetical protein [Sutterellaceae bacterium]